MEIDAGIRHRMGEQLHTQVKVFEVMVFNRPVVEQVRAFSIHYKDPVLDGEGTGFVAEFPILKVFAVEEGNEPGVLRAYGGERK
jgi:hypothetical protein